MSMPLSMRLLSSCIAAGLFLSAPGAAAPGPAAQGVTVTVVVEGVADEGGQIGVALFSSAAGFPEAHTQAAFREQRARRATTETFVFEHVPPGRYAAAAHHDLNGDGTLQKSTFGSPREPWGVTRDVRHRMRAPRFDEAAIDVRQSMTLTVRVAQ